MSLRSSLFKGGSQLAIGQMMSQVFSFLRNLIIARIIAPADFGIAATFSMTVSLVEMVSNIAAETLIVQAPDGDEPRLKKTAQFIKAARGVMNGFIMLLLADPVANLFGVPQARWAFRCLAIFPVARGLASLDMFRLQRQLRFWPTVLTDLGSNGIATLIALPLAFWLRNYSVMLWVLLIQSVCYLIISHLVAGQGYGWDWDKSYAKRIMVFGWPLLVNTLLMYFIFEGDRFAIGSARKIFSRGSYTLTDLGVYSVAFALTMAIPLMFSNITSTLFLPVFASVQDDYAELNRRYLFCAQVVALAAAVISIPFILAGGWAVVLLYGHKYANAETFVGWLAAMWALRVVRNAPVTVALAKGDTRNSMYSNMARSLALVGMFVSAALALDLHWIAISGFIGEALALVVCLARLQRKFSISPALCLKPFGVVAAGLAVAGIAAAAGIERLPIVIPIFTSLLLVAVVCAGMLILFPEIYQELRAWAMSKSLVTAVDGARD